MDSRTETNDRSFLSQTKLLLKGGIIALIVLVLLIPANFIQDLVRERETRQGEAQKEIASKWAGQQTISGPIIKVPYRQQETDESGKIIIAAHTAYFLPEDLRIASSVIPEVRYRGIYKTLLYTSSHKISGTFRSPDLERVKLSTAEILWGQATVQLGVSESRGLSDTLSMDWNGQKLSFMPQASSALSPQETMESPIALKGPADLDNAGFQFQLQLNGSENLFFTPLGKNTTVAISSPWNSPSFVGSILPQTSEVSAKGFKAVWKSSAFTKNYPPVWLDNPPPAPVGKDAPASVVSSSAFGVAMFQPVNTYTQTMRSVKYAALCIILTFAAFFIIELVSRRSINAFQYVLIGLALLLFYTLLLSISEYIGFSYAYLIAAIATVALITWFSSGVLHSTKYSLILCLVLALTYTYIFTTLQVQDYALLLGSIGLFVALAVIMHFSKRISTPTPAPQF